MQLKLNLQSLQTNTKYSPMMLQQSMTPHGYKLAGFIETSPLQLTKDIREGKPFTEDLLAFVAPIKGRDFAQAVRHLKQIHYLLDADNTENYEPLKPTQYKEVTEDEREGWY